MQTKKAIRCLLLAILIALPLQAQSLRAPKIRVITGVDIVGFECNEALEYYRMAAYLIESQPGIRLRFRFRCEDYAESPELSETYTTFYALNERFKRRQIPVKYISRPLEANGLLYTGGLAFIGLNLGFGWSYVTPRNQSGVDRGQWALVVITHEMGHILGAQHDEAEGSIMSTVALGRLLANPNQTLAFTANSRKEIRKEVRAYRRGIARASSQMCVLNSTNI